MSDKKKKYYIDQELCAGCSACLDACPEGAIDVSDDGIYSINNDKCSGGCEECVEICPFGAIKQVESE